VAKKKHSKTTASAASVEKPAGASEYSPRRVLILSIAFLCVLCLIQYWGILSGVRNFWEDLVEVEFPFRVFTKLSFFKGEFPHWNPFSFCGMPFFATGTGVLYPFNLLISLMPVNSAAIWYIMQAVIVLHVLIAGVCMCAYLRFRGRSNAASLLGAVSYMLGGYIISHVIHPSIFFIAAWLPLMLLLMEKGIKDVKPRYMVMGGLLLGAVMQVGHAQVMFYAIVFMLTYALFLSCQYGLRVGAVSTTSVSASSPTSSSTSVSTMSTPVSTPSLTTSVSTAISRQSIKPVLNRATLSALYFAIAAGLCLVQYLPIFEASGQTLRSKFTMADASQGSLQIAQLLTAFIPKLFGAYTGGEGVPSFWLSDAFQHGYYNYWESCFYVGVSTLILSLFAFRKLKTDRTAVFYVSWIALSFLIALGGNFFFYKILFNLGIPGFNSFRHTPRILFVWAFIFPVTASAALDSLKDIKASGKMRNLSLALCAAATLLGLVTAAGGLSSVFPDMGAVVERARYASAQGIILLVNAVLFGVALILFFKNVVDEKRAKILIVVCVSIDMLIFAAGQHITTREGGGRAYQRADGGAYVQEMRRLRGEGIYRSNTRQYIVEPGAKLGANTGFMMMMRNQGYVSAVEIMEGYSQFRLKYAVPPLDGAKFNTMLDLMNVRYYVDPRATPESREPVKRNAACLPRAKLFYKAAVLGGNGMNDGYDSLAIDYMNSHKYDYRNEVVVADKRFERFSGGAGTGEARITKYGFNRIAIDVDTDKEAILWLSEIWYPAWKATVNGNKTEVHRANYSFRAITVPAGHSKVVFKFESLLFNIGALISLLTLLSSLAYLTLVFIKRKKIV
jgi:hypothetical protein